MQGCFNPNLGQIWTNTKVGLKKKANPMAGFDPKLRWNNPAFF